MNTYCDPVRDLVVIEEHFFGIRAPALTASVVDGPWAKADTSAAGSPTVASVTPSECGEIALSFTNTNEVQNLCLYWGDKLGMYLSKLQRVMFRIKAVAALNAASILTFGVGSARNDDPDAVATSAYFKLAGSSAVVCETDDGTNDLDDKATGLTLVAAHKWFVIDFAAGLSNVKFYMGDAYKKLAPVCKGTTFNMSAAAASAAVQPIIQLQKTADTNTDSATVDYFRAELKMSA